MQSYVLSFSSVHGELTSCQLGNQGRGSRANRGDVGLGDRDVG
jgi:hypothetical protein